MARRNKLDIFAEILKLAKDGSKKTRLVYLTNSNFSIMKKYIRTLIENGFIELSNGQIFTTEKGFEFLEKYKDLSMIFGTIENERSKHAFMSG